MPLNAVAVTAAGIADANANAKVDSPVDSQSATDAEPLVIEPAACVSKRQNGVLTQAEALYERFISALNRSRK